MTERLSRGDSRSLLDRVARTLRAQGNAENALAAALREIDDMRNPSEIREARAAAVLEAALGRKPRLQLGTPDWVASD